MAPVPRPALVAPAPPRDPPSAPSPAPRPVVGSAVLDAAAPQPGDRPRRRPDARIDPTPRPVVGPVAAPRPVVRRPRDPRIAPVAVPRPPPDAPQACARKKVGFVVIDEDHGAWLDRNPELKKMIAFALRIGFGKYVDPDGVAALRNDAKALVAPLGPTAFDSDGAPPPIHTRRYAWGFLGRAQSPARAHALASFLEASEARGASHLLHVTAGLDEAKARSWRRGLPWDVPSNESSWRRGLMKAAPAARSRFAARELDARFGRFSQRRIAGVVPYAEASDCGRRPRSYAEASGLRASSVFLR